MAPRGFREPVIRDRHLPEQVPIDAYGAGGFRFADMSHRGSIRCLPSGIHGWDAVEPADLVIPAFDQVVAEASQIRMLLVGTGEYLVPLREELRWHLRAAGTGVDVMSTGAAVHTNNILLDERRPVAAALLAAS